MKMTNSRKGGLRHVGKDGELKTKCSHLYFSLSREGRNALADWLLGQSSYGKKTIDSLKYSILCTPGVFSSRDADLLHYSEGCQPHSLFLLSLLSLPFPSEKHCNPFSTVFSGFISAGLKQQAQGVDATRGTCQQLLKSTIQRGYGDLGWWGLLWEKVQHAYSVTHCCLVPFGKELPSFGQGGSLLRGAEHTPLSILFLQKRCILVL